MELKSRILLFTEILRFSKRRDMPQNMRHPVEILFKISVFVGSWTSSNVPSTLIASPSGRMCIEKFGSTATLPRSLQSGLLV